MIRKLALVVILFLSCIHLSVSAVSMPTPEATQLWDHISQQSPYPSWKQWDDSKGLQVGEAPHAPMYRIFVNDLGHSSLSVPVNFGTIVVKENIGKDHKVKTLTVMYKAKGFDPDHGDWFWAKYSPQGKVENSGKVQGCIGCHRSVNENDYLFIHSFKNGK